MLSEPDLPEIEAIPTAMVLGLREMDNHCSTGLCDYVSASPYAGKRRKDEAAITWGVTKALQRTWRVDQCEHDYPNGGGRCDRVIEMVDGSRLWLEIKLAWRTWFHQRVKNNTDFYYKGYFDGIHHSHSVAGDFSKLERIGSKDAKYLALLLVGFDAREGQMTKDMAELVRQERLVERGWHLSSDAWVNRHSAECWNRCWFGWRAAV